MSKKKNVIQAGKYTYHIVGRLKKREPNITDLNNMLLNQFEEFDLWEVIRND